MRASGTVYFSVDIETAVPNPSDYAMLAIGACQVDNPEVSFYIELVPDQEMIEPEAIKISGLNPEQLKEEGTPPLEAMETFERWLLKQIPEDEQPVFVGFNAAFDWMFIADYFHRCVLIYTAFRRDNEWVV